jgi:hypothetical protein
MTVTTEDTESQEALPNTKFESTKGEFKAFKSAYLSIF